MGFASQTESDLREGGREGAIAEDRGGRRDCSLKGKRGEGGRRWRQQNGRTNERNAHSTRTLISQSIGLPLPPTVQYSTVQEVVCCTHASQTDFGCEEEGKEGGKKGKEELTTVFSTENTV